MTTYHALPVDGQQIFYREAGSRKNPTLVLLHGYPASSHMYGELMEDLADDYHLIAPDYPGFGNSDTPPVAQFSYTFDHLSEVIEHFLQAPELGIKSCAFYLQDYGGPIGFRIAIHHPEMIKALILQNTNAYEEGFTPIWEPIRKLWNERTPATEAPVRELLKREITIFAYSEGTRDCRNLNPDNWNLDQYFLDRPNNAAAQLDLFTDYRSNVQRYPEWQAYFRRYQPPALIVWGKNDPFFSPEGAAAYQRDLPNSEMYLLDTGHFALEEERQTIAEHIHRFLPGKMGREQKAA